jgi:hypothetical protein
MILYINLKEFNFITWCKRNGIMTYILFLIVIMLLKKKIELHFLPPYK